MARIHDGPDLLFGILALQNGMIEQADLIAAFQDWSRDRSRSLGQVMVDRGVLTEEAQGLLDGLVRMHLAKHGGDPERSLAAARKASAPSPTAGGPGADLEATLALLADLDGSSVEAGTLTSPLPADGDDAEATTDWGRGGTATSGGRFRVLRPHARGGIGMVSVAMDTELHREVAYKEIQPDRADDPDSRARFVLEAEVTGRLEHPGIVPVYGLGTLPGGRPYYAMRFVRGETLKEAIARFHQGDAHARGERALALRQLLSRFLDVCDAVGYAHSRGVIHRDIKPANILLGPYGETLLVDWGLAKVIGREEAQSAGSAEATLRLSDPSGSSETRTGSTIGTPAYMSPEQARGRLEAVGTASDVYSLGATLYCLLTGRPPVEDRDVLAVIRRVQVGDFPSPRHVDRRIPAALEAVVLRAMAARPEDRYPSARVMAGDVEGWLADEPVSAYREPVTTRLARWARRHKPVVAAAAVLLITATAGLTVNDRLVRAEKDRTEQQRRLAVESFRKADEQRRLAQRLSASLTLDRGLALCERGEVNVGLLWLARALETMPAEDVLHGDVRANLAGWHRRLTALEGILRHPREMVLGAWFRPDARTILTISRDAGDSRIDVTTWDMDTLTQAGSPRTFGYLLAWYPTWIYLDSMRDWVDPATRTLLAGDTETTAGLWEISTGRRLGAAIPLPGRAVCAAFGPDGRRVVIGGTDGTARLHDAATGAALGPPMAHRDWVQDVAFSPDGSAVATASRDGSARIWDAATGRPLLPPWSHGAAVLRVAFRPDGKAVATGGMDGVVRLWDVGSGRSLGEPIVHPSVILVLVFSPDGRKLVAGSQDGTVRVWDASSGRAITGPLRHQSHLVDMTFGPDGRTLVTCGDDNRAALWDAETGASLGSPLEHLGSVCRAVFSPDGRRLLTAGWDFEVQVWDTSASLRGGTILRHGGRVIAAVLSPDGRTVLTGSSDGTARLWDAATGRAMGAAMRHEGEVYAVAFRPDGRRVVTGARGKAIRVWDAATGAVIGDPIPVPGRVQCAEFSPDGKTIVVGDMEGTVQFLDADTRRPLDRTLAQSEGNRIEALAISPDGRLIATGGDDTTGRIWDFATGRPIGQPLKHQGSIRGVAFGHDGKLILTGGWDKAVRLWDPATGKAAAPALMLQSLISAVALSPDDRSVLVGCEDGTARIWDLASGKPLSPVFHHGAGVCAVAFRPDGRSILTGSRDGTARLWENPAPADGPMDRIGCWIEVVTRMELSADGMARVLDAGEWEARRKRLQELGGPPLP